MARVLRALFFVVVVLLIPGAARTAAQVVIQGPTLTMDPNMRTPLAGVVELETDARVHVQLSVTDGLDSWTVGSPLPATIHYIPVVGMRPDRTYTIDVELLPGGIVGTLFATTGPLPADFPTLLVVASDPAQMEPGYTLTDCARKLGAPAGTQFYSMIVDNAGEVVWYTTNCLAVARFLPTAEIMFQNQNSVVRMDLVGNERHTPLEYPGLGSHHDIERTPHGTYISMDQQLVNVPSFPTSDTDPAAPWAPAVLLDDSIVEFLPDGTLRREWPTTDLVDVTRIGYDSLVLDEGGWDWTHGNAAHYRQSDDSIVISLRSQDATVKFSRETGQVEWILAPHENWSAGFDPFLLTPTGTPFRWSYHQHAPMWVGPDRLLVYDNGNNRTSPFDGNTPIPGDQNFSRAVEYEINEGNLRIQQVWEYGENIAEPLYTPFIGDADYLPTTGNRLITFGATNFVNGVASATLGFGNFHPRLVEVTDDVVPIRVFELALSDPGGAPLIVYRSERIPGLYPAQTFLPPNGVGNTLVVVKSTTAETIAWAPSPVDAAHSDAEHYRVYTSASANAGFGMAESSADTSVQVALPSGGVTYVSVVAANLGGTSGDEPNP